MTPMKFFLWSSVAGRQRFRLSFAGLFFEKFAQRLVNQFLFTIDELIEKSILFKIVRRRVFQ